MASSISKIAVAAGVSPATVSRVFNHHPYVKDDIKERVFKAARELNYSPKSTSNKNSYAIMVGGKDGLTFGAYENQLTLALYRKLFHRNANVEIITDQHLPFIYSRSFKAVVILTGAIQKQLPLKGIPTITVNLPMTSTHSVCTDHAQGIEIAVDHFISKGHLKIGIIIPPSKCWGNSERLNGYKNALLKHGINYDESLVVNAFFDDMLTGVATLLKKRPTGIVLCGEGLSLEFNHAIYLLDKKIPDDISVISFEAERVSALSTPPHTTVNQNMDNMASAIIRIIDKMEDPNHPVENIMLDNELIIRDSVKTIS